MIVGKYLFKGHHFIANLFFIRIQSEFIVNRSVALLENGSKPTEKSGMLKR